MGPLVLDKRVKFDDPSLNRSRKILRVAVGGDNIDCFPNNFRSEVNNDVIFGKAVDNVGMDVPIKCGESRFRLAPPYGGLLLKNGVSYFKLLGL